MMPAPQISIIVAVARNGVIGRAGALPWHLPGDLPRFKRITLGHPVIMGRKTWESLPKRPLPGRRNLVITRKSDWSEAGAEVFGSLDAALAACADEVEVFVIGGSEVFRDALPLAQRLLLTEIAGDFQGDAFFPPFDRTAWREAARETITADTAFPHRYDHVVYERVRNDSSS